jgi:hypothetical protein
MLAIFGTHLLTEILDSLTKKPLLIHGAQILEAVNMTDSTMRDGAIFQAQEAARTRDTLILQKVNAAHKEAFKIRFPGQVEHVMRLIAERLQAMLIDKPEKLNDPETWTSTAEEIALLSTALHEIYQIHKEINQ